jgi:hypothetical protein
VFNTPPAKTLHRKQDVEIPFFRNRVRPTNVKKTLWNCAKRQYDHLTLPFIKEICGARVIF